MFAELSILLHRALEARVRMLMAAMADPCWQQEVERLHDVRVASRRVRAVLDLVSPELYPGYRRQRRRLKGLTRALGGTREMDVHSAILEQLADRVPMLKESPGMEHFQEVIEIRRCKARRAMERALSRLNLHHLPQLLEVPSLPDPFRGGNLPEGIWACLEPWLEGCFPEAALLDEEDVHRLHLMRIRVKRLRYALEVLASGFPAAPEAQVGFLRAYQTALGDHHDRATLEALALNLHQGLVERHRPALAAGIQLLVTHLAEEREIAFEQYRALAVATGRGEFVDGLRRGLGLGGSTGDGVPGP
jgi:CHAD domain-containing protein